MKVYRFNCNGIRWPAYVCDQLGDNSGEYYRKEDVAQLQTDYDVALRAMSIMRQMIHEKEDEINSLEFRLKQ